MDRRGEVVVIYWGRQPQPSWEVWVSQVGVVGYEPFYVWVIVELRRSIPKGTVDDLCCREGQPYKGMVR